MKRVVALLVTSLCLTRINGAENQAVYWLRYMWNVRIEPRYLLHGEFEKRHYFEQATHQQTMSRIGLRVDVVKGFDLWGGFSFFRNGANYPEAPVDPAQRVNEFRAEAGAGYAHAAKRFTFYHRFRNEFRFQQEEGGRTFAGNMFFFNRTRYLFSADYLLPLKKWKHDIRLRANTEIMVNAGKALQGSRFDQYRGYLALQFELIKNLLYLEPGYLYIYQKRLNREEYFHRHTLRITMLQRLAF